MKPYLVKTPRFVQRMFPERVWAFSASKNEVYLTFDDGPIPEVTPWVLDQLKEYEYKATFFCIGDNVKKHPEIFKRILEEGHRIGNHTFNHLNGWKTDTNVYLRNVEKCENEFSVATSINSTPSNLLFRPPYGKMTQKQSQLLLKLGYRIIMWDVLSADFDTKISEEKCLDNVISNLQPGSLVVLHDSLKARKNLEYSLPRILKEMKKRKWKGASIV